MSAERNIRLLLEYNGSRYLGWQEQHHGPSIKGELLTALTAVLKERPFVVVAGRTDAGVHALGQVANFRTTSTIPAARFAAALNAHLPPDITIHRTDEVPDEFDARQSSVGKRYRYRVYQARERAALEAERVWHIRQPLNVAAMLEARLPLIGERDFESFRSVHCDAPHARRNMFSISIEELPRPPVGHYVDLVFYADAFCRHMCRILAGNLIEVGMGRRSIESISQVLASRDRTKGGMTAPAFGLTLLEVLYPSDLRERRKVGGLTTKD